LRIYLTRHGQTEWNLKGKMQGWKNSDLTEKGIGNAQSLGRSLKDIDFDKIYSSSAGRTLETSKHIRGDREIEIIADDRLIEMGFGIWEGMEHEEVKKIYAQQHKNFWEAPHLYTPIDGEEFHEVKNRVDSILEEIIRKEKGNVLIVTHAVIVKVILSKVKGITLDKLWDPPFIHDTCLSIIEIEDGKMKLIKEADIGHLEIGEYN
jgi:probable phosphoglycerate mutase